MSIHEGVKVTGLRASYEAVAVPAWRKGHRDPPDARQVFRHADGLLAPTGEISHQRHRAGCGCGQGEDPLTADWFPIVDFAIVMSFIKFTACSKAPARDGRSHSKYCSPHRPANSTVIRIHGPPSRDAMRLTFHTTVTNFSRLGDTTPEWRPRVSG